MGIENVTTNQFAYMTVDDRICTGCQPDDHICRQRRRFFIPSEITSGISHQPDVHRSATPFSDVGVLQVVAGSRPKHHTFTRISEVLSEYDHSTICNDAECQIRGTDMF